MKIRNLCSPLSAALLGLALWGSPAALHAATIPVTSLADSGPGSLRVAIASAAAGDTIDATAIAGTIVLASELVVDKSLTLTGPGQDDQFSASGGIFSRASLTLSDCTIRGNSIFSEAGWYGGGVTSLGPLTVTHCLISGNSGDAGQFGGGIVTLGSGATTVLDSTIVHNGNTGIYASSSGVALISQCTLSRNTETGVVIGRGGWTIDQCTVSGNGFYGLQAEGFGKILNSTIVGHPIGIIKNPNTGGWIIGNTIFDNDRDINQTVFPVINDRAPISLSHNLTRGNAGGDGSTGPGGWLNPPTDRRNTDPCSARSRTMAAPPPPTPCSPAARPSMPGVAWMKCNRSTSAAAPARSP
jgi:parallel beta-helix repeat protein